MNRATFNASQESPINTSPGFDPSNVRAVSCDKSLLMDRDWADQSILNNAGQTVLVRQIGTTTPDEMADKVVLDSQLLADLAFKNARMKSGKPIGDVLIEIYKITNVTPFTDTNGDKIIDRIADLIHQSKNTNTTGLSEKNKELSAQNAQLQADIAKLRDKNTFLANENDRLNELCSHPLQGVFDDCIDQAASGKGEERHGHGKPFMKQPWVTLGDTYGTGFLFGQAAKKLSEAQSLPTPEARLREHIGAINYIGMGILHDRINANPAED